MEAFGVLNGVLKRLFPHIDQEEGREVDVPGRGCGGTIVRNDHI